METEGKETPAKSRIEWTQITISALVTAFLSLAVALLVFYFTSKEPRLTYEIFPTSSFSGETRELIIQNIRIQNEGDKEAEKVQVVVSFPASTKISDANFEASSLALGVNSVPDTSEFKRAYAVPMLNPNEYISFSFLVENYSGQGIDVAVRGTGVGGVLKEVSNDSRISTLTITIVLVLGLLVGGTIGGVFSRQAHRSIVDRMKEMIIAQEERSEARLYRMQEERDSIKEDLDMLQNRMQKEQNRMQKELDRMQKEVQEWMQKLRA